MPESAMLRKEIETIIDNQNDTTIKFRNGSTIVVLPALDTSRGARSTFIIYEEFRQIDKFIVDSVISPMQEVRPTPYKDKYPELVEQPKDAYISSAWYTSHWMATVVQDAYKDMFDESTIKSLNMLSTLSSEQIITNELDVSSMKTSLNNLGLSLDDNTMSLLYIYYTGYNTNSKLTLNGSHGCINLPKDFAYKLYEDAYVGMPVIIY